MARRSRPSLRRRLGPSPLRGLPLALLLLSGSGWALDRQSAQLQVSGHYREQIVVVPPQLDLAAPAGGGLQAQTLSLLLPADLPFRLALDAGQNPRAQQRRMVHREDSTSFLPYELYQDAAGQQAWGDGGGAVAGTPLAGVGTGVDQSLTVWARLPQGLRGARPGDYRDAVTISVSY
jgi:hypothetical protein